MGRSTRHSWKGTPFATGYLLAHMFYLLFCTYVLVHICIYYLYVMSTKHAWSSWGLPPRGVTRPGCGQGEHGCFAESSCCSGAQSGGEAMCHACCCLVWVHASAMPWRLWLYKINCMSWTICFDFIYTQFWFDFIHFSKVPTKYQTSKTYSPGFGLHFIWNESIIIYHLRIGERNARMATKTPTILPEEQGCQQTPSSKRPWT